MHKNEIISACKDQDYHESLTEEQRSLLPENPEGMIELSDKEMELVAGGINININIERNISNFFEFGNGDIVITEINATRRKRQYNRPV